MERPESHTATVVLSNIWPRDVEMLRIPSGARLLSKADCSAERRGPGLPFLVFYFWRIIASPELMNVASLRKAVWCR